MPASKKKQSRSKKYPVIPLGFKAVEIEAIQKKAKDAGLPVATYLKMLIFTHPKGVKPATWQLPD